MAELVVLKVDRNSAGSERSLSRITGRESFLHRTNSTHLPHCDFPPASLKGMLPAQQKTPRFSVTSCTDAHVLRVRSPDVPGHRGLSHGWALGESGSSLLMAGSSSSYGFQGCCAPGEVKEHGGSPGEVLTGRSQNVCVASAPSALPRTGHGGSQQQGRARGEGARRLATASLSLPCPPKPKS